MPNHTHDTLRHLISKIVCKPGWRFRLNDTPEEGLRLVIFVPCDDARNPGEQIAVQHYFPVPLAAYNEASWARWVFECCRKVEDHELGEFFRVEGVAGWIRPFAPLHGPGADPYTIHEFRPMTDALTRQDGRVDLE